MNGAGVGGRLVTRRSPTIQAGRTQTGNRAQRQEDFEATFNRAALREQRKRLGLPTALAGGR